MPQNILLKTNLLVSLVIIIGVSAISAIHYKTSQNGYMENIEQISALTSDGIYHRLESIFVKPVNISLTMAASPLLNTLTASGVANIMR